MHALAASAYVETNEGEDEGQVLARLDVIEADEANLHGEDGATHEKGTIRRVHSVVEPVR